MTITEADQAATDDHAALSNYLAMKDRFFRGEESMGVADMYERACLEMGLWKEVASIDRMLAGQYRGKS